jgi:hypothetical protein
MSTLPGWKRTLNTIPFVHAISNSGYRYTFGWQGITYSDIEISQSSSYVENELGTSSLFMEFHYFRPYPTLFIGNSTIKLSTWLCLALYLEKKVK